MPHTFHTTDRLTFHNVVCFNQERAERASVVPGSFFRGFDLVIGKPSLNGCAVSEAGGARLSPPGLGRREVAPGHWHDHSSTLGHTAEPSRP